MSKYSEMEIQIAKNLTGKGYKWIAKDYDGALYAFRYKPYKDESDWCEDRESEIIICSFAVPIFQGIKAKDNEPTYIEDILNPQILDEVERHYLETVLKPLRKVEYIARKNISKNDFIRVYFADNWFMEFPPFKADTMYKGMIADRDYTPKELGLKGLK